MKIAIVSRGIPDSLNLMNGIFEMDQASALVKAGYDVKMLVIDLRSIRRWRRWGMSKVKRNGVECYIISIPVGRASHSLICSIGSKALERLYKYAYKNGEKPDIIHAHFTRQGYMAAKIAKKENIPLVITEHSSDMAKKEIDASLLKIAKESYPAAEKIISVGKVLQRKIKKQIGIDSIVIPNIVSKDFFISSKKKHRNKTFTFVSVGGLITRKRMNLLIDAFAKVHSKYINTELIIFGRGPEKEKLRLLIESLGLHSCVSLRGIVKREEIISQYSCSDAFVLLSERETFGVAYIEALAAGLPVIATKCGGPDEFMCEDFGYYIDVDDEQQAVDAMIGIYENYGNYSPEIISKRIREMFSPEAVSKQLTDVYQSVIERRS